MSFLKNTKKILRQPGAEKAERAIMIDEHALWEVPGLMSSHMRTSVMSEDETVKDQVNDVLSPKC